MSREAARSLALLLAFCAAGWLVYAPALHGPPISDDFGYLLNPWVVEPSWAHLVEILDPTSQATRSLNNYAPLRALVNTAEYWLFGQDSFPYHAINLGLHALAAWLLVALFRSVGCARWGAVLGGALFLLHPANVEGVAWMSQVWTPLALALALGALLLRRRLLAGSALFALALLAKPLAASVLPCAALLDARPHPDAESRGGQGARAPAGRWLVAWTLLFALYAAAELATFLVSESGTGRLLHPDLSVHLRSMLALAARYLVLAATSLGASAFHQPPPALSLLDPWWLAGLAALLLLGWRTLSALRRRSAEGAFLVWAAAGFAPVSQVFAFLYPMADRYLYFILPGLLGAALCAAQAGLARCTPAARRRAAALLLAAGALLGLAFATQSAERARLWRSEELLLADSARHYPDGVPGLLLRARAAAARGDAEAALQLLGACRDLGWDYYTGLATQPVWGPIRADPRFVAFLHEMAARRIESGRQRRWPTQLDLRDVAYAHELRGELEQAIEVLERALALSGPLDAPLRAELARLRAARGRAGAR